MNLQVKTGFDMVEASPLVSDFIQGQRDCRDGVPADCDGSEEYLAGYSFEYQVGETVSARANWVMS